MEERDYYEVLQLHPSADHTMIVQAYWHLARKYKTAMDRDAYMEHALEELNHSFDVLGDPESRAAYDRMRAANPALSPGAQEPETKRVSIEVCFWNLPAWQGMVAATGTVALAVVALASGAQPLLAVGLTAGVIVAALFTLPERFPFVKGGMPLRKRWRRNVGAADLSKSTSQILARWRETNAPYDATPLIELSKGNTYPPDS